LWTIPLRIRRRVVCLLQSRVDDPGQAHRQGSTELNRTNRPFFSSIGCIARRPSDLHAILVAVQQIHLRVHIAPEMGRKLAVAPEFYNLSRAFPHQAGSDTAAGLFPFGPERFFQSGQDKRVVG